MRPPVLPIATREGQYVVLQLAWPGRPPRNAGILLIDPATGRGWRRFTEDWGDEYGYRSPGRPGRGLRAEAARNGRRRFARLARGYPLEHPARERARDGRGGRLHAHARPALRASTSGPIAVRPFVTHLPLYSLRAAATHFGADRVAEEEPEDWVAGAARNATGRRHVRGARGGALHGAAHPRWQPQRLPRAGRRLPPGPHRAGEATRAAFRNRADAR